MFMIKKPKPVECRQWTGDNFDEIQEFANGFVSRPPFVAGATYLLVKTPHGDAVCEMGDYVFKGGDDDFYPVKAAYVAENYERTDNQNSKGEVHDHKVTGKGGGADDTVIVYFDDKGQGGARHHYSVLSGSQVLLDVRFQDGPIQEVGVNGVQQEHLLTVVIDRLRDFQAGPFAGRYNDKALGHCEEALMWLQRRTVDRIRRGVEGYNKA